MAHNDSASHNLPIALEHDSDGLTVGYVLLLQNAIGQGVGVVFRQDRHGLLNNDGPWSRCSSTK